MIFDAWNPPWHGIIAAASFLAVIILGYYIGGLIRRNRNG